jgi:Na+/H+-dicarboxylate symporter
MNVDWFAVAALAVVIVIYVVIFYARRRKFGFTKTILAALAVGVVIGLVFQGHTDWIKPIGKIYVTTLSAIVMPVIIVSILSSVTSLGTVKQLRGIGARSVLWLIITNAIAIVLTLGVGLTLNVGVGANLDIDAVSAEHFEGQTRSFYEVLIGFFPRNVISDIADEQIIPVILFTVLIAVSYVLVAGENKKKVRIFKEFVDASKDIIMKAVSFIIELTPYAVLSLVAVATSNGVTRSGMFVALLIMLAVSFALFVIDLWGVNSVLLILFAKINPLTFFRKAAPAQLIGFSTQSSVGTLPVTTRVLTEEIGVGPEVTNFTAPLGTTIGMPGCAGIWPVLTAIFGVNGLGISYEPKDWLLLGVMSLLVTLGTAGMPGTATIVTASVLTAVGLPLEIMVLTIPISAVADTGRTATNITGAMTAAVIVAREENDFDEDLYYGRKTYEQKKDLDEPAGHDSHEDEQQDDGDREPEIPQGTSCKI